MSDLTIFMAVIGRVRLIPGILPIELSNPKVTCHVAHSFPKNIIEPDRGLDIDISDCTLFTVAHLGQGELDLTKKSTVENLFERSIYAVSEVIIWNKTKDIIGKDTSFTRQFGRLDVKVFLAQSSDKKLVLWANPLFKINRSTAAMLADFLPNFIISNGPAANPIPPISRRVMSSLDLINLGFYTESFINLFSVVDDLTQEVIKSGFNKKGLSADEQNNMLRAIKEDRLKIYLCNLAKLCDWSSLEDVNPNLYKEILKVNTKRNNIMHGSTRLGRIETIESLNILLLLIDWLRKNPFGYQIPKFPLLKIAEVEFSLVPLKENKKVDNDTNPVGADSP